MGLANIINRGEKPEGSAFMAAFVAVFVAFGGILFGYDTGTISGIMAMPYVKETFTDDGLAFTSEQTSLITSILSAGTFTGAICAPWASDTLGRRLGLIFFCAVFAVGAILQTASTGRTLLIVGRVVAGLGVGGVSSIVPLYQSEVAPKWIRGAVVSIYQFAITIGLLLAAIVNNATKNRNNTSSYRIPLGIQLLWALILTGGLILLPETPRFWIMKGDYNKAAESLRRLRRLPVDHEAVQTELLEIQSAHDHEMQVGGNATWAACFSSKGSQLKRMMTGIAIQALQQLTGINFIFYYGTEFFKKSNINNPFLIQMITNIVNVVMTIPGIMFVDRVGRRKLLLIGAIVMCSSELIVAAVGTAVDNETSSKVLIAFTCTFIAGFASTWGPIAWVVIGEIFPLRIRAKGVALCAAANWLFNFAIAFATPYLVDEAPGSAGLKTKVFFIWGGCNFICIAFVYFFIYETKGLTLEEVDDMYAEIKIASRSHLFVPTRREVPFGDSEEKNDNQHVFVESV
uniref:Putative Sugar Porter n=1 Tax=Yarrowia yakushimensis TaxID=1527289 RepID=A0A1N6MBY5_9ASCO|nr:putative Sugar Porter [Yarrowia yakushimensis]